jgi:PAS domain S-box-containing protein
MDIFSRFHPLIARWFLEQIGEPTEVQKQSWQQISGGGHVLITAPTGSGKTLAAFLWAINQLATGQLATWYTGILYVSPLRALNNDIQRNLLLPLDELGDRFHQAGIAFPAVRVQTRSGDTPSSERARLLRHPPEILITTPESLNLLLSSASGRAVLKNLSTVILDEIHAVRKDGCWYIMRILPYRTARNEVNGLVMSFLNIDEQRKAVGSLRETSNLLENLFNYANAPIIVWNARSEIIRFNHAFERLTGRNEKEVLGEKLDVLFPEDSRVATMKFIRKTTFGKRWEVVEIPIQHVDGSVRTVLWNSAAIFSADGKTPVATIAQGHDITERKKAEAQLADSLAELQSVLDTAPVAIWICRDPKCRNITGNIYANELFGVYSSDIWHKYVKQHNIGPFRSNELNRFGTARGGYHVISRMAELDTQYLSYSRFVINYQHPFLHFPNLIISHLMIDS